MTRSGVLISWIAKNNDPYGRDARSTNYTLVDGEPLPGPTLTLLFNSRSPYLGKIEDAVLFYRETGTNPSEESLVAQETRQEIIAKDRKIRVHLEKWQGHDPTDHEAIFSFLKKQIPVLRRRFEGGELVIHASPGTPSMHTIWVLMAETGYIPKPFTVVKSYRRGERSDGTVVAPIDIGIDTFYKAYVASRPKPGASDFAVFWDRASFRSQKLIDLFDEAARFARLNVPVMIIGERGTGKTTLGGWIREHSAFNKGRQKRLISVSCGHFSPGTMRSELFGHVKGSYTGAAGAKEGLLSVAHNDTLFLDEVGDISSEVQRMLLKALEEKEYLPLGGDQAVKSNFRLITATNLPWPQIVEKLHPDFLDRISAFVLKYPPLREIPEDIEWLWRKVYAAAAERAGVGKRDALLPEHLHHEIVRRLQNEYLPGNLRSLYQVAFHVLALIGEPGGKPPFDRVVEEAVGKIRGGGGADEGDASSQAVQVARHFAEGSSLEGMLKGEAVLDCGAVEGGLKRFMAQELRRVAKKRSVPVESLCTVTERTIRSWFTEK